MRPNWDDYFMEIVRVVRTRSTCVRRQVGAILVKGNRLLATGYNGAPKGALHCNKKGCLREQTGTPSGERHEICRGLHAEQNVIIQAAIYGASVSGATLYCNNKPCSICAKMIINAEISRIVYQEEYDDALSDELLRNSNIRLVSSQ